MAPTADELQDKTVDELRELASEANIEGRSSLDKDGLVAALADDVDSPTVEDGGEDEGPDRGDPFHREGSGEDEPGAFATASGAAGELDDDDLEELAEEGITERTVAARAAATLRERQDKEGVPARFRRTATVDPALRRDARRTAELEERSAGTARSGIRP